MRKRHNSIIGCLGVQDRVSLRSVIRSLRAVASFEEGWLWRRSHLSLCTRLWLSLVNFQGWSRYDIEISRYWHRKRHKLWNVRRRYEWKMWCIL